MAAQKPNIRMKLSTPMAPLKPSEVTAKPWRFFGAQRMLFISGQIPVELGGKVPSTFIDQARLAWRNLDAQVKAAEMSLDNLVKVTLFLSNRRYALENRQAGRKYWREGVRL